MSIIKAVGHVITDLIPGGDLVKSALGLVIKNAAKKVGVAEDKTEEILKEANRIAAEDIEIKKMLIAERQQERDFILAEEGRFAEKPPIAQLLSSIVRPLIAMTFMGLLAIQILVRTIQFIFHAIIPLPIAPELIDVTKWCVAFYFVLRSGEKGFDWWTKRKNGSENSK